VNGSIIPFALRATRNKKGRIYSLEKHKYYMPSLLTDCSGDGK
jgi:hypothetical protein